MSKENQNLFEEDEEEVLDFLDKSGKLVSAEMQRKRRQLAEKIMREMEKDGLP